MKPRKHDSCNELSAEEIALCLSHGVAPTRENWITFRAVENLIAKGKVRRVGNRYYAVGEDEQ